MGKTTSLYIGRGASYQGIWYSDKKPDSFLRKNDTFLEYIRKHLSSTSLSCFSIDAKDRIFKLSYHKWGHENHFYFFYCGPKLYFANIFYDPKKKKIHLYRSWNKQVIAAQNDMDFRIFDEVGRREIDKKVESKKLLDIQDLLDKENELASKNKKAGKTKKFYQRKIQRINHDLERVKKWKELYLLADNEDDFSSYEYKTKLLGIKIRFEDKEHFKRRNQLFEKAKKLKMAVPILEKRLSDAVEKLNGKANHLDENTLEPIKPFWNNITVKEDSKPQKTFQDSIIFSGIDFNMAIGLTAKGNDYLRKNWANKEDYWFHLDGDKSSHILVKLKQSSLDPIKFQIIGSAMLDFSKIDYSEANLIYTQVKNLKGIPGVVGSVNYKKEKRIRIEKQSDWRTYFDAG